MSDNNSCTTATTLTNRRQLIIDGSNGPLYLDRTYLDYGYDEVKYKLLHRSISLLHVLRGESRGTRIHLIPRLDRLLARGDIFDDVTIYFDGLGKRDIAGRFWDVFPHVRLQITDTSDEADDVIVAQVQASPRNIHSSSPSLSEIQRPTTQVDGKHPIRDGSRNGSDTCLLSELLDGGESVIKSEDVFIITRTSEGPGKSRNVLKYFQLLRRESVFCMFGFVSALQSSASDAAKCLINSKKLIRIERRGLGGDTAIVVTDDVLLRQRVVDAGGFVMTFEQMWDLLNGVEVENGDACYHGM